MDMKRVTKGWKESPDGIKLPIIIPNTPLSLVRLFKDSINQHALLPKFNSRRAQPIRRVCRRGNETGSRERETAALRKLYKLYVSTKPRPRVAELYSSYQLLYQD
jgi:hypothetical protein